MTGDTAPLILSFDTSGAYCAAALLSGNQILTSTAEEMSRGQAERLMPLLEELLTGAGKAWRDLTALGVGVGPGNFTGIRIAVSAARGLALGLDIPAVGVSGCDARSFLAPHGARAAIPAPRELVYLCAPDDPTQTPRLIPLQEAESIAHQSGQRLHTSTNPQALAESIAHIAASRWQDTDQPPAPLYVRPVDAAPSRDQPPVLLD